MAEALRATAAEMAGYRTLPMVPHDMAVMADGKQMTAFEKVVAAKQALLAMLQAAAERDQRLLAATRAAPIPGPSPIKGRGEE